MRSTRIFFGISFIKYAQSQMFEKLNSLIHVLQNIIYSSRFIVEQISDGSEMDGHSLQRRNAQKIEKVISGNVVSRAPLLSAIEEGGTITSISQLEEDFVCPEPVTEEENT